MCIPVICDIIPPTERRIFKLHFCRGSLKEEKVEIAIRMGFNGLEKV